MYTTVKCQATYVCWPASNVFSSNGREALQGDIIDHVQDAEPLVTHELVMYKFSERRAFDPAFTRVGARAPPSFTWHSAHSVHYANLLTSLAISQAVDAAPFRTSEWTRSGSSRDLP